MAEQNKKAKASFFRRLARLLTAVLSVLFFIIILAQLSFWAGAFWLQSAAGRGWLENNLSELAAESGYTVRIQDMSGLTWGGVNIGKLDVSDKSGPVLDAEQIRLRAGIFSLLAKEASLSVTAESLSLYRFPKTKDGNNADHAAAVFAVPDVYFKALHIDKLSIKKLILAHDIIGHDVTTAVDLSAKAERNGEDLKLSVSMAATQEKEAFLPAHVDAEAVFSPAPAQLAISNVTMVSPLYSLKGKGVIGLGDAQQINFEVHGDSSSLPGLHGKLTADGHVTGTFDKPVIEITGTLSLDDYAASGLEDIRFTATSDNNLAGHIDLKTVYQKNDMALGADFLYAEDTIALKNIKGTAPDISLTGAVDYNISTALAAGRVDVSGRSKATVVLSSKDGLQAADVSVSNFSAGDVVIDTLKAGIIAHPAAIPVYALSLEAKGKYQKPFTLTGTADLEANSAETAIVRNISASIRPPKGVIDISGSLARHDIDLAIKPKNVPLNALPAVVPDVLGKLEMSGTVQLKGAPDAPAMTAVLDFSPLQAVKNMPPVTTHLTASSGDGKATVDIIAKGRDIKTLQAHTEFPFVLSLYPFRYEGAEKAGLHANIVADMELKSVAAAFLPEGTTLAGRMKADIRTSGAPDSPEMTGNVSLAGGSFLHAESGTSFKDIDMHATLDKKTLYIKSLEAKDNKNGRVTARGTAGIGEKNMPVDLSIQAKNINPFRHSDLIAGIFSGDVVLSGDSHLYRIGGKVETDRLDIKIPERFNSAVPRLNIVRHDAQGHVAPDFMKSVNLNLKLVAARQVFVRGWGLDAEFGGTADVSGTLAEPLFNGTFDSKRGRYEEFGKLFDLQYAHLRFQGAVPPSPYLDVLAETKVQDITAQISLTGNIGKPEVKLSSIPVLPQDEVLSRILFGKDMTKISPFQAVQLANTLQRFSGKGGGFEPLSMFRKATGLDDLQIERDEKGGTTVGAGKYITDKVYLEAETGSGENSGAAKVKIDLTPHVKAESKIGQDNKTGGGIFWQWDY